MKKYRKRIGILLAAAICCLFAGCGADTKNVSVKEGMEAVQALDYNTALQCFEKAMANGENLRILYRGQGLAYMGLSQYEEAAAAFEKALLNSNGQIDNMDYDINYYLATAYEKLGQNDKGIEVYDAMIALRPKEKMAYFLRGCLRVKTDFDKAKADFDKAISLDGTDYDQLIDICAVMNENGYKEAAQEYLQAVVGSEAKISDYDKGRMYYYLEDYDNAKNFFEKARENGDYQTILFLGKTYETLGDYNYAVSVYSSFIEKDQTNAEIYNQLGLCKNRMGAYQEALTAFQAGMNVESCSIMQTLKFNEIVTYEYLEEFKKAAVLMENYLNIYPDDEVAQREYTFLKTR